MIRRFVLAAIAYALLLALAVKAPVVVLISLALGFWLWGVLSHTAREMDATVEILAPRDEADQALRDWKEGRL